MLSSDPENQRNIENSKINKEKRIGNLDKLNHITQNYSNKPSIFGTNKNSLSG